MSSLAWNIKRKMEWMGRNLRKIDNAVELIKWASALRELNSVLKELDIKEYKDNWRPWSQRDKQGKNGVTTDQRSSNEPFLLSRERVTVPQVGLEESSGSDLMNNGKRKWSRPPKVEVEGDDVEWLAPKAAVMKMLNDAKELQEKTQQEKKNIDGDELVRNEVVVNIGNGVKGGNDLTENQGPECSEGHGTKLHWIDKKEGMDYICDVCKHKYEAGCGLAIWRCSMCDFDLCQTCGKERGRT